MGRSARRPRRCTCRSRRFHTKSRPWKRNWVLPWQKGYGGGYGSRPRVGRQPKRRGWRCAPPSRRCRSANGWPARGSPPERKTPILITAQAGVFSTSAAVPLQRTKTAHWLANATRVVTRSSVAFSSPLHGVHAGRANATRRSAATSGAPARFAKSTDYEANRLLAHAESALRRDHQRHRIQRIPHTTAGLRTRQGDLESGGWLKSPVAANRTAEFGRDTGKSAADLRHVGTGTGSTEVRIPEVGGGLRVQVRHGGLLGCGGACHRSSLTSKGFHDEQVKPVRRM
jgi:hypothetical protein